MKDTLKFFWPIFLLVSITFELALLSGNQLTNWGMQSVVIIGMIVMFIVLHKIKNKIS